MMGKPKLYTYEGKSLTLRGWSEETGIPFKVLVSRVNVSKWSIEKALTTPISDRNKTYRYKGKELTLREWSDLTGIPLSVLISRVNVSKWSMEKVLTAPIKERNKKYRYKDRELTLKEWSKETGLSAHLMYMRMTSLGWSIEDALTNDAEKGSHGGRLYEYEGLRLTLREWSELKGISLSTLAARVYKSKMTIDEALTKALTKSFTSNGKTYRVGNRELTLMEWSKERDVSYASLYYWVVKKEMSMSDALDYLINKKNKMK